MEIVEYIEMLWFHKEHRFTATISKKASLKNMLWAARMAKADLKLALENK